MEEVSISCSWLPTALIWPLSITMIIAQRIASVQDADLIIILDNGQVSAVGNHEELMKTSAIYQDVFYSQQKGGVE